MIKKETFKNVILTLLIVSSFFLTVNIWFVKELWSSDYSSFLYSFQNIFESKRMSNATADEAIERSETTPAYIALTLNSKKTISYLGSDTFLGLEKIFSEIMGVIVKGGNASEISDEDFLAAHKTNSILLRFMMPVNFSNYVKKDLNFIDLPKQPMVSSFILSVTDTKHIYFRDEDTKKNYRLPIVYDDRKYRAELQKILDREDLSDLFAFELNADKKKPEVDLILYDTFAPLDFSGNNIALLSTTPILYNYTDNKAYDSIFKTFNIAKNSAGTYTDKDNILNFIENHSTFKIMGDGSFIYETTKQSPGILIDSENELSSVISFVNILYKGSLPESDGFLRVVGVEKNADETIYTLDYMTNNGLLYFTNKNAVSLTVKNSHIILYKQFLCSFKQTNNYIETTDVRTAYDAMHTSDAAAQKKDLTIKNIFPANIYPNKIGWIAEFSDNSILILE